MKASPTNLLIIGFLFANCVLGKAQTGEILKHTIHEEELYDAPIKTQVMQHVIITESQINEQRVNALLNMLYNKAIKRTGFRFHFNPTSVYIYVYTSQEKAASGAGQWIGMISKSHVDTGPHITISDTQMKSLSEIKEEKWGIPYLTRQKIWIDLILSEDRAVNEADQKYSHIRRRLTQQEIREIIEYSDQLRDTYFKEVAAKYGTKMEIMDSVSVEGRDNGWPFPELE